MDADRYYALCNRGFQLIQISRYTDAERELQSAITLNPLNPHAYLLLAQCYNSWPGKEKKALEIVDRALALGPNDDHALALKAGILIDLDHDLEGLKTAEMALAIDPVNTFALKQQTRALLGLGRWRDAEENSLHTLEVAPRDIGALQLLAVSFRQMGKIEQSRRVMDQVLAQVPNNPWAQVQAGQGALRAGDFRQADTHFREALRLDPNIEAARAGLIASLNSRVWFFRVHYQFRMWLLTQNTEVLRILLIVGLLSYNRLYFHFKDTLPIDWGVAVILILGALLLFPEYFANCFLLMDPFARLALTQSEKTRAGLSGLAYLAGMGYLIFLHAWVPLGVTAIPPFVFLWAVLAG
jgi:tetratricopeptide (TPR) repeat protein